MGKKVTADRTKKDHRGFSVIELIIVMAIIAALSATAALSTGLVFAANARTCANDMMNVISECRIATMSQGQGNVRLLLYRGDNGGIYSELQTRETADAPWTTKEEAVRKIGARRCSVGSVDGGDDLPQRTNHTVPASESGLWEIYFDRSSGSLREETNILDIYICGGSRHYHIHLEELTGKATLKQIEDMEAVDGA